MGTWEWLALGVGGCLGVWAAGVGGLLLAGRRVHARALAGFIPDCLVLLRRLLGDPGVPARSKALMLASLVYLVNPVDLIPDFIPVAGQLDDAVVVALALRSILRSGGEPLVREHWPGPEASLAVVLRVAGGRARR